MIFRKALGSKRVMECRCTLCEYFAKKKYILKSARRLVIGFRDNIIARAKLKFGGIFLASFG
ncbi:MAG: hypothetical protein P8K82_00415 [Paracoccaceae bacterium]|nr:hypothetical protein [Paracoccaceae bacterium]